MAQFFEFTTELEVPPATEKRGLVSVLSYLCIETDIPMKECLIAHGEASRVTEHHIFLFAEKKKATLHQSGVLGPPEVCLPSCCDQKDFYVLLPTLHFLFILPES